jgi:energy-coupling factor transporter transmembrane protein EcfT
MKPRNLYRIIIGVLMVASGIVSIVLTAGEATIGSMLTAAGIVFLLTGIINHRKYGEDPESDERSKKIGAYGITYAWLTGLLFMFALFWLDYLNVLTLSVQNALAVSILILALSAAIYQIWLFRKGDVE